MQPDSHERLNVKQTRKIYNFANQIKVVECAIAHLIEQFSLFGLLDFHTSEPIVTTLKNLQNPMSDQNAIFGDEN